MIKFIKITYTGWKSVINGEKVDLNLETAPLYLKTDSAMGSSEEGKVGFYTAEEDKVGGFLIKFSSSPLFALWHCTDWKSLPTGLPTDDDKVWKITLTRTTGIRIVVQCNNVEVLNMLIFGSTCASSSNWNTYWSNYIKKIEFTVENRAFDLYSSQPVITPGD